MQAAEKLIRKQFLILPSHAKKLETLARQENTSAAEMVRKAIAAYDPGSTPDIEESELLELVATRLKETIKETRNTRERLDATLKKLSAGAA